MLASACVVFAVLPGGFYSFIFGEGFQGMSQYMQWLIPGILGNGIYLLLTYWQSAAGRFKFNLIPLLVGVFCNLMLSAAILKGGNYALQAGIFALVAGWVIAAFGALYMLQKKGGGLKQLLPLPSFGKIKQLLTTLSNRSK
ncbi:MAG: hypothetical protein MUF24_10130 [Chitinophagaceae bacterium]|nr:hypothetical protein [Chitinophagaceae bacterium]